MIDLISLKERIIKIKFMLGRIRYSRERHYFIGVFMIVVIISVVFVEIYFNQKKEIKVKENILKSYYNEIQQDTTGGSGTLGPENRIDSAHDTGSNSNKSDNDTPANGQGNNASKETVPLKIKVYICGSILCPGVYELDEKARLIDLIEAAGGASENACLEVINLAAVLYDQDMVYIPSTEEIEKNETTIFEVIKNNTFSSYLIAPFNSGSSFNQGSSTDNISGQSSNMSKSGKADSLINLNTASSDELEMLPGIGEKIAQDIVTYRQNYGGFSSIEQIKNVKGIGEKKFESIKDFITIQ